MRPAAVPVKWVPSTSAFVVAAAASSARLVARAARDRRPRAPSTPDGGTGSGGAIRRRDDAAVTDPHTEMPGGVCRRHLEVDAACECRVGFHRFDKPGVDHGPDGIGEHGRVQRIT